MLSADLYETLAPITIVTVKYAVIIGLLLFVFIMTIILSIRILRIRWKPPVIHALNLQNSGNVVGRFRLLVESPGKDLNFNYYIQGQKAQITSRPVPSTPSQPDKPPVQAVEVHPAPQVSQAEAAALAASGPVGAEPGEDKKKELAQAAMKAKTGSQKALGMGRLVGGMVGTLGSLIPGDFGKTLKEASVNMQGKVQTAGTAVQMPEQKLQSVSSLKGQASSLASSVSGAKGLPGSSGKGEEPQAPLPQAAGIIAETREPGKAIQAVPEPVDVAVQPPLLGSLSLNRFVETAAILPGDSLTINLHILPRNPYRTAEYVYWLFAHQVADAPEIPGVLTMANLPAASQKKVFSPRKTIRQLTIRGISPLYGLLTALILVFVISVNAIWTAALVNWIAKVLV